MLGLRGKEYITRDWGVDVRVKGLGVHHSRRSDYSFWFVV
jgi:hypothetical protein